MGLVITTLRMPATVPTIYNTPTMIAVLLFLSILPSSSNGISVFAEPGLTA
jgi:hypothetical protein